MNVKKFAPIGYGLLLLGLIAAPFVGAYPVFVMKLLCFALFATAFNLKLLLARKSGEYLGDVEIVISDAKGAEILKATSEGPIFMANLPAGSYEVAATTEGLTQKQRVTVVKGKLGTTHFRWP